MASIKRSKGNYYARVIYLKNGIRREKTIPLHCRQKAKALKLLPIISERERLFKAGVISLEQIQGSIVPDNESLVDEFLYFLESIGRTKGTIGVYNFTFNNVGDLINIQNIGLLRQKDFQLLLTGLKEKYDNNYTINLHLRNIRAFFNWLVDSEKLDKIPYKIKLLPVKKQKPKYFTNDEIKQILECSKPNRELYSRIIVHVRTGMRINELEKSYYHAGFIRTFDPCKNGVERDIPIDIETLKHYRWLKQNSKHLSTTISKKFLAVLKELDLYYSKSGSKRSFHSLRHSYGVKTYYETRDIYRVKTLLGHSSVTTTEIYANFELSMLEQDFRTNESNQEQQTIEIQTKPKVKNQSNLQNDYNNNYSVKYVS